MTDHTAEPFPSTPPDRPFPEVQCASEVAHDAHQWSPGLPGMPPPMPIRWRQCPGFVGRAGVPAEPLAQGGIVSPTPAPRCLAVYPSKSRDPNTRIVHCQLPAGHAGDHEETDTESTWPQQPPRDRGICGAAAPTLTPSTFGGVCTLLAGHTGWHDAGAGGQWGPVAPARAWTIEDIAAAREQGIAEGQAERDKLRRYADGLEAALEQAEQYARDLQDGGVFLHEVAPARAGYEQAVTTLRGVADRTGSASARYWADYLAVDPDRLAPAATEQPYPRQAEPSQEPTQPVTDTTGASTPDSEPCCDLHGRNCEQGGEECCERCTEAHHFAPGHGGVPCSAPDLGGAR